uniref:RING-type domain-containing protein n=1 Tax=Aplanochytrium stocchinoi TaxID=215587 RepID=A0A7S3PR45_9STRA|mmetsp:Transcript_19576/g.24999  ORF Transcript_19576/g.24999 Transcript_19576/m.24999 type:complete len:369 (-) Transcript_19576:324-1430(-)|eukprot:CAMPEP_0204831254 /NCGR_PEP_ID=MMETSP1346-20131115/10243_1 /ASSEMBLY_ACC=CAM_ASM_000771 /TAXON_ID=215587 /ORGANISM="Aplanochytrium stocchinoi, Strain GSBS06" /LENGTH=368 /DNA_ID=CAMNT_0051962143 /DNA_START=41 /DNA_END=1147 /DNA_ORIENTATION=-
MKRLLDQTSFGRPHHQFQTHNHPTGGALDQAPVTAGQFYSQPLSLVVRSPAPFLSSSSSSSLDPFLFNLDPVEQRIAPTPTIANRNVRRRVSSLHTSPQMAPSAYTTTLQDILTRFHVYTAAKATGRNGASKSVVKNLPRKRCSSREQKSKHCCTLCLEDIERYQYFTTLPCGHIFHTGSASQGHSYDSCRGILYWLENNRTCPQCRNELEPEVAEPSDSEKVIVPLLNRQFSLIQAQSRLIDRQRLEMQELHARFTRQNGNAPDTSSGHWQDARSHHDQRVLVLKEVTDIAVSTLNWRIMNCSQSKLRKLRNLAAKVELILYSEAPNLEGYQDLTTLEERVLGKIKKLILRAKKLKAEREETGLRLI